MKDNVAQKEVAIQEKCQFNELFQWQWNDPQRKKSFVLHDGPPYANGEPHVGHALNKIMKDIANRYKLLRGYRIHYFPGWDCHGMPIEQKALAEARADDRLLSALDLRNKACSFARKAAAKQLSAFRRWGVMADWQTGCYYSYDKQYEANQLEIFYQMYEKGYIYQDYMPVFWSPSSRTALAEAEIEYDDNYCSPSVYVRYRLQQLSRGLLKLVKSYDKIYAIIWTTTPWTLPVNQAICFASTIQYCAVKADNSDVVYVVADAFREKLSQILGRELHVVAQFDGSTLDGCTYSCATWSERTLPLVAASHVTVAKGTGLVHTAPAHGAEDFQVALQHQLPMDCYVDKAGHYTDGTDEMLVGKNVLSEGNELVLDMMSEDVVSREMMVHSYPHDWRTKQPLIIRASKQWFVDTTKLKHRALECLENVTVIPKSSSAGMTSQLDRRNYWCISRQRVWGVPLPVFYEAESRRPLVSRATVNHLKSVFACEGSDSWWSLPLKQLLPDDVISQSGRDPHMEYVRGDDVLDIWFDSGVSWASALTDCGHVADVYLEGVDQFGGWFQSSLLTSVAVNDQAPYRSLVVHGFVMDEDGKKMSKSLGNVIDPDVVVNGGKDKKRNPQYGADVLRLWVAQCGTVARIHIGPNVLADCHERLFRLRKSLRYLMSNLDDFDPSRYLLSYTDVQLVDRYMLHLLQNFISQVTEAYEEYNYSRVVTLADKFNSVWVSAFHAHITKDRMYCSRPSDAARRSAQSVQFHLLDSLTRVLSPIIPHLCEEAYQYHPLNVCSASVFKRRWFESDESWYNAELASQFDAALAVRTAFHSVISSDKPGDHDVIVACSSPLLELLQTFQSDRQSTHSSLCEVLQSASVTLTSEDEASSPGDAAVTVGTCSIPITGGDNVDACFSVAVKRTSLHRCPRCRRRTSCASEQLCRRCADVVAKDADVVANDADSFVSLKR